MAAAEEPPPLTGVAWASAPGAAPAGWTVIATTVEGAAANLGRGFGLKGGAFLCLSASAQAAPGAVVADVQVLSDRSPLPAGYVRAREFPESRPAAPRRKRVCVKLLPRGAAATAVLDLKLSGRSGAVPGYQRLGSPEKSGPPFGSKHASLTQHESVYDTSNIYGLSAMDGVPFTLHPRFEGNINSGSNTILADLNVKSLAEIEEEYNYAFVIERTAAARLPPSIC
ncbi:multivesicular body subunit 12A isoform X2 [Struthio camelus]|uniref:multivesicular body subunit 12A isoform X2 n=1 Tax=Struthio camelus TaxID=8801 RepID=UPI0036040CC5